MQLLLRGENLETEVQMSLFGSSNEEELSSNRTIKYDKNVQMAAIVDEVSRCTACRLHLTRTNTVPGEGALDARLMFIGEGPGADEDAKGRPFVGAAGKLLTSIIAAMGMKREDVFIGNVVKCRPPENRVPEKDEMESCIGYIRRQIKVIKPRVIVLLGATAYKAMIPDAKEGITKARGKVIRIDGIDYMPTFHPAALLMDPSKKPDVWADMKKVMAMLREEM